MKGDSRPAVIHLPPLSDQAAVEILDFLQEFVSLFESLYGDKIRRYDDERSPANLIQPEPTTGPEDTSF